jgi:hypothetical protein
MAVILVQADLQLPAGVRRPAVRAASATLPVHLGHCFSSDLSRRWLAFAGKGLVVVLYRILDLARKSTGKNPGHREAYPERLPTLLATEILPNGQECLGTSGDGHNGRHSPLGRYRPMNVAGAAQPS